MRRLTTGKVSSAALTTNWHRARIRSRTQPPSKFSVSSSASRELYHPWSSLWVFRDSFSTFFLSSKIFQLRQLWVYTLGRRWIWTTWRKGTMSILSALYRWFLVIIFSIVFCYCYRIEKGGNVYFKQSCSCKSTNYVFVTETTTINTWQRLINVCPWYIYACYIDIIDQRWWLIYLLNIYKSPLFAFCVACSLVLV